MFSLKHKFDLFLKPSLIISIILQLYVDVGHNFKPVLSHHLRSINRFYKDCFAEEEKWRDSEHWGMDLSYWLQH